MRREAQSVLPAGGGACGDLIRARDWSATSLGPIETWPQSLKSVLTLLLHSPVPLVMLWGEDGVMLYNDAYSVFAGGRHPQLLGSKVREGWPEVADFNDNVMKVGLAGGALAFRDQELTLYRHGRPEQVWMNLDYSPVFDESGSPAGVIAVVVETTERVLSERRRAFVSELSEALLALDDPKAVLAEASRRLGERLGAGRVGYGRFVREANGDLSNEVVHDWCAPGVVSVQGHMRLGRHVGGVLPDIEAGRPVIVADVDEDPRTAGEPARKHRGIQVAAEVVWPLVKDDRLTAVLFVNQPNPRQWTDDEVALIGDVAERTWSSLQRAMARDALRQSEARLRLGLEAGRMVIWEYDFLTDRLTRSDNAEEIFGPGDTMAEFLERIPEEVRESHRRRFEGQPDVRGVYESEVRYRRPDGAWLWLHDQAQVVRDAEGCLLRGHGVTLDITARKTAQLELARLNERLSSEVQARTIERDRLFELTDDLVAVAGFDGYLKMVNPAWTRLLGFDEAALLATPFIDLMIPDDRSRARETLGRLAAGDVVESFENRLLAADGRVFTLAWTISLQGELIYALGRDVTREREREAALRQSQKMEAVGQLTGGIAHDFNNLLGAVVGSFELIRRHPDQADRVFRYADAGLAAAERGARLTSQLLTFSRAQKLELRPIVPADVIEGMGELLDRSLGPRIAVDLQREDGGVYVRSDPVQLEMAVLNLAINARDAMPDGGRLTIATRRRRIDGDPELAPGDYLELSVRDEGEGMTPDVLARALDPFFTTKEVGKGTGLGLSQVYGVARQSGGVVRIDSEPGKGTTVRLLLPQERPASAAQSAPAPGPAPGGGALEVLLIDDDPDMRGMLAEGLAAHGYAVKIAASGEEGLSILRQAKPDALVVDFAMPGLTGDEVVRHARALRPGLPVILISGYSDSAAVEQSLGPGAVLLRKPFRLEALDRALQDQVSARPSA